MDYKNDWPAAKKRLEAFLHGELIDRCCIAVTAPKEGVKRGEYHFPATPEEKKEYWTNGESILQRHIRYFETTFFGGEAFPVVKLDLGAAGLSGFFKNTKYQFEQSIWYHPFIQDPETDLLEFDPGGYIYRKTLELATYFTSESRGRYMVSTSDISGNLDALAHMRGNENLMIDFIENPEIVHKQLAIIQDTWIKATQEIDSITRDNNEGGSCISWLGTWGKGRHDQLQCDMSAMISPDMFTEFALPDLIKQSELLDSSVYHLDGYEQIRHLDSLLAIPKINVIQWTCVTGQPSPMQFISTLQRIQKAGKGLLIHTTPELVEHLMAQLSSKGLYMLVAAPSESVARDLLTKVEQWTHE